MYVDWEYYKIFYYVAKYQNFTKAARVLGNNQPNITHSMKMCIRDSTCSVEQGFEMGRQLALRLMEMISTGECDDRNYTCLLYTSRCV